MVQFYEEHNLFGYGKAHMENPIFYYETFNREAVRVLRQANLDRNYGYNYFDFRPATHDLLSDKIRYTLSVVNHFIKTVIIK